jgi:hypothetical protein
MSIDAQQDTSKQKVVVVSDEEPVEDALNEVLTSLKLLVELAPQYKETIEHARNGIRAAASVALSSPDGIPTEQGRTWMRQQTSAVFNLGLLLIAPEDVQGVNESNVERFLSDEESTSRMAEIVAEVWPELAKRLKRLGEERDRQRRIFGDNRHVACMEIEQVGLDSTLLDDLDWDDSERLAKALSECRRAVRRRGDGATDPQSREPELLTHNEAKYLKTLLERGAIGEDSDRGLGQEKLVRFALGRNSATGTHKAELSGLVRRRLLLKSVSLGYRVPLEQVEIVRSSIEHFEKSVPNS